jgi:hypothetical protein
VESGRPGSGQWNPTPIAGPASRWRLDAPWRNCGVDSARPVDSAAIVVAHVGMDNKDDCLIPRKKVNFRKEIADKIGVGYELPESIS